MKKFAVVLTVGIDENRFAEDAFPEDAIIDYINAEIGWIIDSFEDFQINKICSPKLVEILEKNKDALDTFMETGASYNIDDLLKIFYELKTASEPGVYGQPRVGFGFVEICNFCMEKYGHLGIEPLNLDYQEEGSEDTCMVRGCDSEARHFLDFKDDALYEEIKRREDL